MRKTIPVALAVMALAAGCKSSTSTTTTSTTSGAPGTTAAGGPSTTAGTPGTGVSDTAIKIGVVFPDLDAVKQFVNIDHGDYKGAYTAIINDINGSGGINGRKIEPVFVPINPIGTDPAAAACTKLTEDDKVFAVLGNQLDGDAPLCYVETHSTVLIGGTRTAEQVSRAKAPWFTFLSSADAIIPKLIDAWNKEGDFSGKKVAVVALAADEQSMKNIAIPALAKDGITPVQTAVIDAPTNDVQAALNQVGVIAQKFQSAGADTVVVVGNAAQTFATGLGKASFRPRLLATSQPALSAYVGDKAGPDVSVVKDALTGQAGSLNAGWNTPETQHCRDLVSATGQKINDPTTADAKTPNTWVSVVTACQTLTLFSAIAKKAGAGLNNDSFKSAGDSLGSLPMPGTGATANYSAATEDGDLPVFVMRFDPATKLLVADAKPVQ